VKPEAPFFRFWSRRTYAELFQNRLDNGGRIFLTNKLVFTKLLINKVFLSITWYDKQALDSIREDQDLEVFTAKYSRWKETEKTT
jgi:hypothetical protein